MKILNRKLKKELKENRYINSYYIHEHNSNFYYDVRKLGKSNEPNIIKITGPASLLSVKEQIEIIKAQWKKTVEEVIILREIMETLELKELPPTYNFKEPEYLLEFEGISEEFAEEIIKTKKLTLN